MILVTSASGVMLRLTVTSDWRVKNLFTFAVQQICLGWSVWIDAASKTDSGKLAPEQIGNLIKHLSKTAVLVHCHESCMCGDSGLFAGG